MVPYPDLTLKKAREKRNTLAAEVVVGKSPADQKKKQKIQGISNPTVRQFGERYYQEQILRTWKDPENVKRYLEKDLYCELGDKRLREVDALDIQAIVYRKRDEGHPAAALRLRDAVKRMYEYAIGLQLTAINPTAMVATRYIGKTVRRSRPGISRTAAALGDGRLIVDSLIDLLFGHPAELFYIALGIGLIFYSCLAKRMSFEGDVAVKPKDRKTYEATPRMRLYGIALGMLPLLYGLYHLFVSGNREKRRRAHASIQVEHRYDVAVIHYDAILRLCIRGVFCAATFYRQRTGYRIRQRLLRCQVLFWQCRGWTVRFSRRKSMNRGKLFFRPA